VGHIFVTRLEAVGQRALAPTSVGLMSLLFDPSGNRWVVRWSDAGEQRTRRFPTREPPATSIASAERRSSPRGRDWPANWRGYARVYRREERLPADAQATGVYSYVTKQGIRWRIAVTQPYGTVTTPADTRRTRRRPAVATGSRARGTTARR